MSDDAVRVALGLPPLSGDAQAAALVDGARPSRNGQHPETATENPPDPLPELPRFPVGKLTGPLAWFVDWGIRDGLHPECVAAAGLAALATLTGPARLQLSNVKTIRAILWIVLVGIASSGKSPAFEHAFALIRADYERRFEAYELELASWSEEFEAIGAQAGPKPRRPPPLEMDDATIEALARWLSERRRDSGDSSGAIVDDEIAAFLEGLNQYKGGHGADKAKWLKLWTGAPLHVERVGDGGGKNAIVIHVSEPVASLAGPLTPDNIFLLGRQGSGFRPRWLPFYAPAEEPQWLEAGEYPAEWTGCIKTLLAAREPRDWFLRGGARDAWKSVRERWNKQQKNAEPDDVIEALRKADTQCLRIMLAIAESMAPAAGGDIPLEAVECAIAIVDYTIDVWRALPGHSVMTFSRAEDVMDTVHQRLLAWLETRPKGNEGLPPGSPERPRATRREVQQWLHEKPSKLSQLLLEHDERFPGTVVAVERERDSRGHGGHVATYVYAPLRAPMRAYPAVAATAGADPRTTGRSHETPGQRDAADAKPAVAVRNSGLAQQRVRNSGTGDRNTGDDDPPDVGPCGWCGEPCTRYGPDGKPLCDQCQGGAAEQEHARERRQQPRRQTRAQRHTKGK